MRNIFCKSTKNNRNMQKWRKKSHFFCDYFYEGYFSALKKFVNADGVIPFANAKYDGPTYSLAGALQSSSPISCSAS